MKAVAFTPDRDTEGKRDYWGAFLPEARAFVSQPGFEFARLCPIDVAKPLARRREQVLAAMDGYDVVAFFCHGLKSGLHQLGFARAHVAELAEGIARGQKPRVTVALYACSTGGGPGPGGDGGFADRLRDALCAAGAVDCEVNAHDRPGHTTRLPFVRRFAGQGSPVGGTGGQWIVAPRSALWPAWRAALQGPMRLRYPMMSVAEIHRELLAGAMS